MSRNGNQEKESLQQVSRVRWSRIALRTSSSISAGWSIAGMDNGRQERLRRMRRNGMGQVMTNNVDPERPHEYIPTQLGGNSPCAWADHPDAIGDPRYYCGQLPDAAVHQVANISVPNAAPARSEPELKPCPFCGEIPSVTHGSWTTSVRCSNRQCECSGVSFLIALWNKRPPSLQSVDSNSESSQATHELTTSTLAPDIK